MSLDAGPDLTDEAKLHAMPLRNYIVQSVYALCATAFAGTSRDDCIAASHARKVLERLLLLSPLHQMPRLKPQQNIYYRHAVLAPLHFCCSGHLYGDTGCSLAGHRPPLSCWLFYARSVGLTCTMYN